MTRVFISSTNLDLEDYRSEVAKAAHAAECLADLQENWTAEDHPPLDACLKRVRQSQVLVVIVAHRCGWVPDDKKRNPDGKSITWLECEEAVNQGNSVLAFVIDEGADWPRKLREEAELDGCGFHTGHAPMRTAWRSGRSVSSTAGAHRSLSASVSSSVMDRPHGLPCSSGGIYP
ncbi:MAG: DUF4062 domain-containing protein [Gammaproteobacteria bacterium]|nr:DUF4062 domain-containing protein [Gammaproteobacteria bacterium]